MSNTMVILTFLIFFYFVGAADVALDNSSSLLRTVKNKNLLSRQSPSKYFSIGSLLPKQTYLTRYYKVDGVQRRVKEISESLMPFLKYYRLSLKNVQAASVSISDASYPMEIVSAICDVLIPQRVASIIYVSASEKYGLSTASAQYLLHMISHTGIPVIAWNADNSGLLVNRDVKKHRYLQMAPPIDHQLAAMVKMLERYGWSKFAVVVSTIAGYQHILNLLRQYESDQSRSFKLEIIKDIIIDTKNQSDIDRKFGQLASSDGRIFLLYATHQEAAEQIFPAAHRYGLTGGDYLWIGTQSIVANSKNGSTSFQTGMLAVNFDTNTKYDAFKKEQTDNVVYSAIRNAVNVVAAAMNLMVRDYNDTLDLLSSASCETDVNYTWTIGEIFYDYLRIVNITAETGDPQRPKIRIEFDETGKLKDSYLSIMNLKNNRNWEKVGYFTSNELDIYDISWPGGGTSPPKGTPAKYHLKIVTLDEPPFVMIADMPLQMNRCPTGQVQCRWAARDELGHSNITLYSPLFWNPNASIIKCCRGYAIDLLNKLASDVGFTFDLYRVEDGKWGIKENGRWNGLVADLIQPQKADMCVTALKINSDRQTYIDFSVPYFETGISVLVALRQGPLSPTAFLEPFEYKIWLFILILSIQAAALAIFIFEWLSPQSYDRSNQPPVGHKFSLFRSYWLVWATFFSTSVNTDIPRSHTSRFMTLVWSAFAMTFLAVYTANLAAFMITRTEYYDLSGIDDVRLTNPRDLSPPFKYGTVFSGNTEETLRKNYRNLYNYMARDNKFLKENVTAGVAAVKTRELDAFIYDSVILQHLSSTDDYCEILTVGKWFSKTGYSIAFPKHSKWLPKIDKLLLQYQEKGDLETFRNYWFTGSCSPKSRDRMNRSSPLGIGNFVSAFVLLAGGIVIGLLILAMEYFYCRYIRKILAAWDKNRWCGLISLSLSRSLSFHGTATQKSLGTVVQRAKKSPIDSLQKELAEANRQIVILEKRLYETNCNHRKCGGCANASISCSTQQLVSVHGSNRQRTFLSTAGGRYFCSAFQSFITDDNNEKENPPKIGTNF